MQIPSKFQAETVQQQLSETAKVYKDDGLEMSNFETHFERKIGSDGDLGTEVKVTVGVTDGQHCVARGQGLGFHTTAVVRTWSQPLWDQEKPASVKTTKQLTYPACLMGESFKKWRLWWLTLC